MLGFRRPPRRRAAAGAALAAAVLATGSAGAADWRLTPSIEVEEAYNDNVLLAPRGRERSDFITRISPGLNLTGIGRNLQLNVTYAPEQVIFLEESDRSGLRHNLLGSANAELVNQLLFFDASAAINQQFINNQDALGGTTLTASNNLTEVQTFRLGPRLRNRFGSFATSELAYNIGSTTIDSDQASDSTIQEATATLSAGPSFENLFWRLTAQDSHTERSGGTAVSVTGGQAGDIDRQLARLELEYATGPRFSLLGSTGYEKIEDNSLQEQPDGIIWDAGFEVRPSRQTSFRATYGRRFENPVFNAALTSQIGPRTSLRATFTETLETTQELLNDQLAFIGTDIAGNLIDTRTGLPFVPGDPAFGLQDNTFRSERLSVALTAERGRNSFDVQIFTDTREFDAVDRTEESTGGSLGWTRRLTRFADLRVGATYRHTEFDQAVAREDDFYTFDATLSYRLGIGALASLSLRRTERDSTTANADLTENLIAARVRKSF